MNFARDLLYDKELSLAEIAEKCGFCDEFHFSRRFKDNFDMTPAKFRKALESPL